MKGRDGDQITRDLEGVGHGEVEAEGKGYDKELRRSGRRKDGSRGNGKVVGFLQSGGTAIVPHRKESGDLKRL